MDESGIPLDPRTPKIVTKRGEKKVRYRVSGKKEQITVLGCVNAIGQSIPPMIIFEGIYLNHQWTAGEVPSTYYGMSDKGWTDQELFRHWLKNHFLKYAVSARPLLLMMDGHSSHYEPKSVDIAKEESVILFCLPPHTTQDSQPLDCTVFGPLKHHWSDVCHEFFQQKPGMVISKLNFTRIFAEAWLRALTPSNIIAGFKKCGIHPFNREAIPTTHEVTAENTQPSDPASDERVCIPQVQSSEVAPQFTSKQIEVFNTRFEEGYNIYSDADYVSWLRLNHPTAVPHEYSDVPSILESFSDITPLDSLNMSGSSSTLVTESGSSLSPVTDSSSPVTDSGSSSTPVTDSGSSSTPVTDSGSSSTPVTDSGSSSTPVTDSGSSSTPVTDSGSSSTPVTDSGSSSTPVTDSGSSLTPVTDSGSSSTPVTDSGSSSTPVTDSGSSSTPVTDSGSSSTPVTDSGSSSHSVTNSGSSSSVMISESYTTSHTPSPSSTSRSTPGTGRSTATSQLISGVSTTPSRLPDMKKQKVSPLTKYLQLSKTIVKVKESAASCNTRAITGARVLTSAECLAIIKEKERKKRELEQEKENWKKVREEKRKQREEENLKKAEQKAQREEERKRKREIKEEERKRKEQGRAAKRLKTSATTEAHTSHSSGSVQPTRRSLRECTNTLVTKRVQVDTEDSNRCCVCCQTFSEDVEMGTGVEWLQCACGLWLHEDCIIDCVTDSSGKERLCPFCT